MIKVRLPVATLLIAALASGACSSSRRAVAPTSEGQALPSDPEAGIELIAPGSRGQTPRQRRSFREDGARKILTRVESDFNGDGRIDFVQIYDPSGVWVREEHSDLDGDGRFDVVYFFVWEQARKQARLQSQHFDTNYDGKIDLWKDYDVRGQVIRRSLDRDFDGRPDYWEHYSNGQVVRIEQDNNGDGKPDLAPAPRTSRR